MNIKHILLNPTISYQRYFERGKGWRNTV